VLAISAKAFSVTPELSNNNNNNKLLTLGIFTTEGIKKNNNNTIKLKSTAASSAGRLCRDDVTLTLHLLITKPNQFMFIPRLID